MIRSCCIGIFDATLLWSFCSVRSCFFTKDSNIGKVFDKLLPIKTRSISSFWWHNIHKQRSQVKGLFLFRARD